MARAFTAPRPAAPAYQRRRPEKTILYQVLAEHLETFLARVDADETRAGLPRFVVRELRAFLDCGILARGFARVHCRACGLDTVVAFSCKRRGFCPSCGARRMADTAAHLVDRVFPEVPVRQWVLSLPYRLRYLLAYDPDLCSGVRRIFVRAVLSFLERRARDQGILDGRSGAVVCVQRFDSGLRLNVHFHGLFLDGVYTRPLLGEPEFHATPPLTDAEVAELTRVLHHRILRWLRKQGRLPETEADDCAHDSPLATCYAAAVQGRIAFGDKAGAWVPRVGRTELGPELRPGKLCANFEGFSLHAGIRVPASNRNRLERLCRYAARPPLANSRMSLTSDGRILYELKRTWSDGSTHIAFDPMTFLERLAALIPRPRRNLVTYHGVLAPAAGFRDRIVPVTLSRQAACEAKATKPDKPKPAKKTAKALRRYSWSELMKRVFEIDVLQCACGARRAIIAFLTDPEVVHAILECLGLPTTAPDIAPARPPPQAEFVFECQA